MAGTADDLKALLALLRSLGEEDYAALTSRGLVRRARRELADAQPRGWVASQAEVAVGSHTVRIPPSGPAQASCTCPSPGACQHVVAACLALVEQADSDDGNRDVPTTADVPEPSTAGPEPAAVEPPDAWSSVELETLRRWTGAAHWRQAVALSRSAQILETGHDAPAVVRFPEGTEVRLPPGGVLDSLIATSPPRLRQRTVAAAVLAVRAPQEGWLAEAEADVAPKLSVELLHTVDRQLTECVRLGLNRLTASTLARFETIAVQCQSAGLYRVARELESCATQVRWIQARNAQADPEQLLDRIASVYALLQALLSTPGAADPALLGTARSAYQDTIAKMHLVGCGAYQWRTPSGFHGLTTLFWEPGAEQFLSWSDSRPLGSGDAFDPQRRYEAEGPWPGSGSLDQLCHTQFSLVRPKMNEHRRLSSSGSSRVESQAEVSREALPPALHSWSELRARFESLPTLGLKRPSPLDLVVRVKPKRFHRPTFDEIEQCLVWPLEDVTGELLKAVVPFVAENANAIQWIENHRGVSGDSLIGTFRTTPREALFPVSRLSGDKVPRIDSLAFAEKATGGWLQRLARQRRPSWTPTSSELDPLASDLETTPLRQLLAPTRERLIHAAESGLAKPQYDEDWEPLVSDLGAAGLIALARSLHGASRSPSALLRAAYTVSLYWQAG